ncbi:metalloprotease TldD [Acidithiobacillus ferrooxidans]|jgi:TldD protein|uniref:TldD protein n=6 Tax=Acidithiobacillus TaxID=119977 RepID=B7J7V1_ACIF2|nr:metalloprotease TldD [Acidithiobacillus ferrooxidans]MCL5956029.1 metalloprotease TldD [Gammaproteobacteria bacterium]ACH84466.1 peptidase U62 modulator of DNA gyrase [Acidithiobacillus ferrooxidans ATCC 53993]ACK79272.1 tldD protein [Acidithiobacillus ferrooxidans ATCC 23270]MBU2773664.1 metalloprotease TldD [Acidithiobacillus ferrooxidans]MBU2822679.1 metalloprotease TldD [Acidithiobacillus ferrooxidans]
MTASALEIARATLFAPGGISEGALEKVFGRLSHRALDDADLYFQYSRSEGFSLEEGVVKSGSHSIEQGVGVRAVSGERQGLAYSDEIAVDALLTAADAARAIVHRPGQTKGLVWQQRPGLALYPPVDPLASISNSEKIALLERVERAARACDPRIVQVMASLNARFEAVLVARLDGTMAADVRPLVRLNVSAIAEQGGRREQGSAGGGGRYDYQAFLQGDMAEGFAREAARQALVNLEAEAAPAGTMEVVLGPGWPGVLLHEAIGHGLEGDFNRKGTSAFSGRVGQRVAAPGVTVVDDGTLDGRRGSLNVDDEGTPTQCTTLIEDGILKGYLQDTLNARLTGTRSTGNGRRESYAHLPMPRMTNTYMRAGDRDPREIIASVKRGLYAVNFGGGQVDITNGKFVFSASEAYLIENGKITRPVKGATLIGNGPDVLTRVEMIGNDLQMDTGVGTCGKDGQSVPVGVGQPTLKIRDLTVGGTQG